MTSLDCACCGLAIEIKSPVLEDSRHICPGCGATCQVFFEDPDTDNRPYFGSWKCGHGIDGDEARDACESDGASALKAASTVLDQVAVLARSATASAESLLSTMTGDRRFEPHRLDPNPCAKCGCRSTSHDATDGSCPIALTNEDPDLQAGGPALTTAEVYELWRASELDFRDEDEP